MQEQKVYFIKYEIPVAYMHFEATSWTFVAGLFFFHTQILRLL